VIAEEFLQENIYDLSKVPFVPDVIFDCGAHIGMFSLLSQARFPKARIRAFEPNPRNIEFLKHNVGSNNLAIEIVDAAVSTEAGIGFFKESASCGGRLSDSEKNDVYRVATIDLKNHLPSDKSTTLLLKIDIEGTEDKVLPDVLPVLPATTAVFLETHDGTASWERLSTLLERSAFRTEIVRRRGEFTDGFASRVR